MPESKTGRSIKPWRMLAVATGLLIVLTLGLKIIADRILPLPGGVTISERNSAPSSDLTTTTGPKAGRQYTVAPGEPLGVSEPKIGESPLPKSFSNEEQHAFLEQQKTKMGIRKILPREQSEEDQNTSEPNRISPTELARRQEITRQWMAQMSHQIGRTLEAKEAPSVALSGEKPAILSNSAGAGAAGGPENSPKPATSASPSSIDASAPQLPKDTPPPVKKGPLRPGGYTARSRPELEALWNRLSIETPIPVVDFEQEILIFVYVGPGFGVEIDEPTVAGGKFIVNYRKFSSAAQTTGEGGSASAAAPSPYQYRTIPRTDDAVEFQEVPTISN